MALALKRAHGVFTQHRSNATVAHLVDPTRGLYAVSDGVKTTGGADTACRLVIEQMSENLLKVPPESEAVRRWLTNAFRATCAGVREAGHATHKLRDMSATLTMLHTGDEGRWHILHAGDSRAYVLQDGFFRQITKDHNLAFDDYLAGKISKETLRTHPRARILTRSISAARSFVVPEQEGGPLKSGQLFVLCSAGVARVLDDDDLEDILITETEPDVLAEALVEAAETRGTEEDITVLVVQTAEET